ncbi:hypothetical protein [uncultured Parasutterella sp.]|uniref:hypothetical protein n=1 Tax=uncultured Parasutterella sp. TaxID=1263098 RepID=UPI002729A31E|nr:hypothetical protein [uncultured Parasutterella sp.]
MILFSEFTALKTIASCQIIRVRTRSSHIRALLDLVSEGNFGYAQGMNKDFICNNKYTEEVFSKLLLLRTSHMWEKIKGVIGKEYGVAWLRFLQNHENEP